MLRLERSRRRQVAREPGLVPGRKAAALPTVRSPCRNSSVQRQGASAEDETSAAGPRGPAAGGRRAVSNDAPAAGRDGAVHTPAGRAGQIAPRPGRPARCDTTRQPARRRDVGSRACSAVRRLQVERMVHNIPFRSPARRSLASRLTHGESAGELARLQSACQRPRHGTENILRSHRPLQRAILTKPAKLADFDAAYVTPPSRVFNGCAHGIVCPAASLRKLFCRTDGMAAASLRGRFVRRRIAWPPCLRLHQHLQRLEQ